MAESIYITSNSKLAKNKSNSVSNKIKDASSDITGAKKELNNTEYVDLSYEINQLETMYKKNNQQASEFEVFASTLEKMVNDYVDTDKNCAKRIKSNGKNHRKNTGLAQNLALATICASFDKIGNKIDQITDEVKEWADGVVDWFETSIKEDWDSYLQLIEGGVSLFVSVGVLTASIAGIAIALSTGGLGAITLGAVTMLALNLICLYTSFDKIISSSLDICNVYETDGSTITKHATDSDLLKFVYDVFDVVAGLATGAGLSKLADFTQSTELFLLLGKGDFAAKVLEFIQNVNKVSNIKDSMDKCMDALEGVGAIFKSFKEGNISDSLLKYGLGKIFDEILGDNITKRGENIFGDISEDIIKNDNLSGVFG